MQMVSGRAVPAGSVGPNIHQQLHERRCRNICVTNGLLNLVPLVEKELLYLHHLIKNVLLG